MGFPGAAAVVAVASMVLVAVASCAAAGLCPALAACGVPLWCPLRGSPLLALSLFRALRQGALGLTPLLGDWRLAGGGVPQR